MVVVQSLSHVRLFATPWTGARQASLSFTISQSLLKLTSTDLVMLSKPSLLCHSLLLSSIFSQHQGLFQWVFHIRWPKYWSFSISPSNEYSGLISFRIDWSDLPAVQRTLKSLLQHHNLKAPNHGRSVFFMVQLADPHMTTGKITARTIRILVGKVTYLCFLICCLGLS